MKETVQIEDRPDTTAQITVDHEARTGGFAQRLNALRAGVLGANDGIVSTAAVVVGVAGATTAEGPILMAGLAAAVGGAVSMALGEYVSVSSQRDSERHLIDRERRALAADPEGELRALARSYEERGISPATARRAAEELFASNALEAQMRERHNIDPDEVTSPWHAAIASFAAFAAGALLPLLAILLPAPDLRVPVAFGATLLGLALTGAVAAGIGGGSQLRAAARVTVGGALALAATYLIGSLLGTAGVV
ncbi:VIT1/CCC1 transporter family protein [Thermobifida halotolerans]|uniref:VIT1/CCC1 transporter family protein n=1 Tax=Thermobifida halotolerans TaxID=483545 RepID=A0A399G1Y0_9ACTN|nr:VIT1/CCC1 transporter family protein [Thermobifida halotolerans]UOE19602.1 VIT1/CCC1 transporter family protein [Thermobifida halotolerans]